MGEHGVSWENMENMENREHMEKVENINQMTNTVYLWLKYSICDSKHSFWQADDSKHIISPKSERSELQGGFFFFLAVGVIHTGVKSGCELVTLLSERWLLLVTKVIKSQYLEHILHKFLNRSNVCKGMGIKLGYTHIMYYKGMAVFCLQCSLEEHLPCFTAFMPKVENIIIYAVGQKSS